MRLSKFESSGDSRGARPEYLLPGKTMALIFRHGYPTGFFLAACLIFTLIKLDSGLFASFE